MVARIVLPVYGGSPAVWNTAVLFFQFMLLAGYLYPHVAVTKLGLRRHAFVHIVLLAVPFMVLPLSAPSWAHPPAHANPAVWLLLVLLVMVGLPFFLVSTSGPL